MHDHRSLLPPNDEGEWLYHHQPADAFARRQSHDPEPPCYRPDTGELIYACPVCESFRTEPRHLGPSQNTKLLDETELLVASVRHRTLLSVDTPRWLMLIRWLVFGTWLAGVIITC